MLAVLFTLALFLVWAVFGLAALVAIGADVGDLRVALTAPILGTALTAVPLFVLSNAGVPMNAAAPPVWVVLLAGSIVILALRRSRLSLALAPVVVLCIVELVLLGRPMFRFGFDWIANANADMAYYVLAATHLMGHGLQSAVDVRALADNRDFATFSQHLHLDGLRPGTEIALGGLAATIGRPPVALYMPMSIAIAMSGVCATGSLAMQAARRWWAAPLAAALLVISPMAGYGVLQQLLPQDWGLALAAALFSWLMRPEMHQRQRPHVADLLVISVLVAALFVVAYEVATSLILAYGLYVVLLAARRRVSIRAISLLWGVPLAATALVVNTFLPRAFHYLTHFVLHFGTSKGFSGVSQFGYAIVPTALPGAEGLRSLFAAPQAPHAALFILAAAGLFVGVLVGAARTAFRGSAAGVTLLADLALGIMLAKNGNDFGLFKLYMYSQPFLAAMVAVLLAGLKHRSTLIVLSVLLAVVAGAEVSTLTAYVQRSLDPIDLRNASASDLLPKFRRLVTTAKVPVITVTDNLALAQLEGASAGERRVLFLGRNPFGLPWKARSIDVPSANGVAKLSFSENVDASQALSRGHCAVSLPTGSQLALNRRSLPEGSPDLAVLPCGQTKDALAFVVSSLGQPATLPENREAVSFWQLEPDPSFPSRTFSGFGRYALFEILGSAKEVRIALDFTTSPMQSGREYFALPPAAVIGAQRVRFPVVGSGSARVISPPLLPRMIGGRPYVVLDMGRSGRFPFVRRPGVTGLWGKSVVLDPRSLTSYVRDVSLVSTAQYRDLRPPVAIRSIPADLANSNLEYSGIYEDGWVARASYAQLAGGPPGRLVINALVPAREQGQRLSVLVNGRPIDSRGVKPGSLDLNLPLPASVGYRKVELRWGGDVRLAAPDRRNAAARLTFLGVAEPPTALRSFPAALRSPGLAYSGVLLDGWLQKDARVVLAGGGVGTLSVRAQVVTGGQRLELRVNGRTVVSRAVAPGLLEVQIPIRASKTSRTIELHWAKLGRIAPNDPRRAAALLQSIAVTPLRVPAALRVPADLSDPSVSASGIFRDGWVEKDARVLLAGGAGGELTIRAEVPAGNRQHLDVVVNGHTVEARDVTPGLLVLHITIGQASTARTVELHWATATRISARDPRKAAALLKSIAIATRDEPASRRSSSG